MTDQQTLFVDAYLGEARGNAAEAARSAGYENARQNGWRLKQLPEIRAAIDERLAANTLTSSEILARWTDVANATLADFYVVEPGETGDRAYLKLDLTGAARLGKLHLVKQIKDTKFGRQIILRDQDAALDRLARAQGLLTDLPSKKMEGLLDVILNALPDEFREQVRASVADALTASGS